MELRNSQIQSDKLSQSQVSKKISKGNMETIPIEIDSKIRQESFDEKNNGINECQKISIDNALIAEELDRSDEEDIPEENSLKRDSVILEQNQERVSCDQDPEFSTFPPCDPSSDVEPIEHTFELEDDEVGENTITTFNPKLFNLLLDEEPKDDEKLIVDNVEILEEVRCENADSDHDSLESFSSIQEEKVYLQYAFDEKKELHESIQEIPEEIKVRKNCSEVTLYDANERVETGYSEEKEDVWESEEEDVKPEKKPKHKRRSFTFVSRKNSRRRSSIQEFDKTENRISVSLHRSPSNL